MLGLVNLSWVIVLIILSVLITFSYVLYSGLWYHINIRTGSPPIRNITIAYKYRQGPYKECGTLFSESCGVGPKLSSFGVFYDDPKQIPSEKCRYAVGSILCEGDGRPCQELLRLYQKSGFRIFSFPEVTHAVTASFPYRTPLSIFLGVQRVYPQLSCYIKDRKLCAHPFIEIYQGNRIHFIGPLARQSDFYVPELRDDWRKKDGEDSEEDRRTDITGSDSHTETSSVSRMMGGSRESSLAPSSLPAQGRRDQWSDGSSDQSSSSFEEVDLELVEGQEEAEGAPTEDLHLKNSAVTPEARGAVAEGEE